MNFEGLSKVESYEWYIDVAFRQAAKAADELRTTLKAEKLQKSSRIELARVDAVRRALQKQLMLINNSFPSIDTLPEFYQELIRSSLDYVSIKKSLGAVKWAVDKVGFFSVVYSKKMRGCKDITVINKMRREFYGRISSVLKQIKDSLIYLEYTRKTMKEFPSVKSGMFTVVIMGFPNVGKTTLLYKLTGSKPEIAPYAFTTKSLNIGYIKTDTQKVQFIDTPGSLNRFEKMNSIEQQGMLAIKYCADMLVYVFDVTEPFPLDDQEKLLKTVSKSYDKNILIYLSKSDILEKAQMAEFLTNHKKLKVLTDSEILKSAILKAAKDDSSWS
jgi:nucleolar GTP-binding protein